jgi:dihydrofolate reductase
MGKVISLINTTPDGFVDAPYAVIDEEYFEFIQDLFWGIGTIAFGRTSFEQFQVTWPARLYRENANEWQMKMARSLADMPKEVYSSTLKTTTWVNSSIVQKVEKEHIESYKRKDQGGLLTFASLSLVATLAEMNLIDDFYFCVQPLLAGKGDVRLFDKLKLDKVRPLQFVKSHPLKSGVQILHYRTLS